MLYLTSLVHYCDACSDIYKFIRDRFSRFRMAPKCSAVQYIVNGEENFQNCAFSFGFRHPASPEVDRVTLSHGTGREWRDSPLGVFWNTLQSASKCFEVGWLVGWLISFASITVGLLFRMLSNCLAILQTVSEADIYCTQFSFNIRSIFHCSRVQWR